MSPTSNIKTVSNSKMLIISINYTFKYRISFAKHYLFTKCGLCYNLKSGRIIKQVLKSNYIGYIIGGKFRSLTYLKKHLEVIKQKRFIKN